MGRVKLDIEYDFDFILVGICCHEKDYRLCWGINNELGIDLVKQPNLELEVKKDGKLEGFSFYMYEDEEMKVTYTLISNRGKNGLLIPEQRQTDYYLMIEGAHENIDHDNLIQQIKNIDVVLTTFETNPENLKSKQNLIF